MVEDLTDKIFESPPFGNNSSGPPSRDFGRPGGNHPMDVLMTQVGVLEKQYFGVDHTTDDASSNSLSEKLASMNETEPGKSLEFTRDLVAILHAAFATRRAATRRLDHRASVLQPFELVSARDSIASDEPHRELLMSVRAKFGVDEVGFDTLNNFTIVEEVGRGACGKVMLAVDGTNDEKRAIKIIPRHNALARMETDATSMLREVAVMKKLRHRNIVRLYEVIDDPSEDVIYLVMQFIDSGPFVKLSHEDYTCSPMSLSNVVKYVKQMIPALRYMHSRNVVHGDIKPDNILIDSDGVLYFADFGISCMLGDRQQRVQSQLGTPAFLAPEVLQGGAPSTVSDMWAVGVTLYVAIFGCLPFKGRTYGETVKAICEGSLTFPPVSAEKIKWKAILKALLEKDPIKRMTANQLAGHALFARDIAAPEKDEILPVEMTGSFEPTEEEKNAAFAVRASYVSSNLTTPNLSRNASKVRIRYSVYDHSSMMHPSRPRNRTQSALSDDLLDKLLNEVRNDRSATSSRGSSSH